MDVILRYTGTIPHGRRLSNHSRLPSPAELFSFRHRVHSFVLKLHNCHLFVDDQVLKLLRRFGAFDYADNCVYGKRVLALILSYYVRRVCEPFALSILCGEAEAYLSPPKLGYSHLDPVCSGCKGRKQNIIRTCNFEIYTLFTPWIRLNPDCFDLGTLTYSAWFCLCAVCVSYFQFCHLVVVICRRRQSTL